MQASELTPQDRHWLTQHADACRLGCDFILHDTLRPNSPYAETAARIVPIWHKGAYVDASTVLENIDKALPSSQIFEQWEYYRYESVLRICRSLSIFDARVLFVASGYAYQDEAVLYNAACESVAEAMRDLYGEQSDADDGWGSE